MAKRGPTKAQQVLNEAKFRIKFAQDTVRNAEADLGIARATLSAHVNAYDALERTLTKKRHSKRKA